MRRLVFFALAGGFAAACNFGSRILLGQFFDYTVSIIIAYVIGMITAFTLNKLFVFPEGNEHVGRQVSWFVAINVLAVLQTLAISLVLARFVFPAWGMEFHPETVAHAIGVAVPIVTSYIGHKRFTFRKV